jgi:hypothetical protein
MEMPPISLHRGAPIHVALYDLQQHKQNKLVAEKKRLEKELENTLKKESKETVNKKSIKYLCQRFEKEFRVVI